MKQNHIEEPRTMSHTINGIDLRELSNEELERLAMDLTNARKHPTNRTRTSVFTYKLAKIRAEWDRRLDA